MALQIGDQAPDFEVPDQNRQMHRLSDYRGRWVVLYFYPKDETSGCTAEACGFRDAFADFRGKAVILGVSADSVESHEHFAEHHRLPFPLLADSEKKIIHAYGADGLLWNKRVSFLIDPEGKIDRIYDHVEPEMHAQEVLDDVTAVSAGS